MNLRSFVLAGIWPFALVSCAFAQCEIDYELVGSEEFAGYGFSVAMDASGDLALVGGPGAVKIDGLCRTYERKGDTYVEGALLAPHPAFAFAAEFGASVDLSDDGLTAVIGAPGDVGEIFGFRKGAVYIFERDPDTGEWDDGLRFTEENPTAEYSFGARVAISGDGNMIVVVQSNNIGTEFDGLPDSVYVITREDDGWTDPVELEPIGPIDPFDQLGQAIAVNEDGTMIVVRSQFGSSEDVRIHIFELTGPTYEEVQTIVSTGITFNSLGTSMAVEDDVLMLGAPGFDSLPEQPEPEGFQDDNVGAVFVYEQIEGVWEQTDHLLPPEEAVGSIHFGMSFGRSIAMRGDEMLVGSAAHSFDGLFDVGAAFQYQRIDDDWSFISRIDPPKIQQHTGYSTSLDVSADGMSYVIGEPGADVDGFTGQGRAHFVDSVTTFMEFEIESAVTTMTLTIEFPGLEPQVITIGLDGTMQFGVAEGCEGEASSVLLTDMNLMTEPSTIEIDAPDDQSVVIRDPVVFVSQVGDAGSFDETGASVLSNYVIGAAHPISRGKARIPVNCLDDTDGFASLFCSLIFGCGVLADSEGGVGGLGSIQFPAINLTTTLELGLGEMNPTIHIEGSITATPSDAPACPADLDDSGTVGFADLLFLLDKWNTSDADADLDGSGLVGFADLLIILDAWGPCA